MEVIYRPPARATHRELSPQVGTKRVWLNISQEGKDDIDDIREGNLINGLKLSSEDLQPITAFQVSTKGLDILDLVPEELKEQVDSYVYGKEGYEEELLIVEWNAFSEDEVRPAVTRRACAAARGWGWSGRFGGRVGAALRSQPADR